MKTSWLAPDTARRDTEICLSDIIHTNGMRGLRFRQSLARLTQTEAKKYKRRCEIYEKCVLKLSIAIRRPVRNALIRNIKLNGHSS